MNFCRESPFMTLKIIKIKTSFYVTIVTQLIDYVLDKHDEGALK